KMKQKHAVVIGSGFAGLSAATHLAANNFSVTLLEKNDSPGGRARKFSSDGFTFDMGPSWYWMPDVFEDYFSHFDKKPADFYELTRLDPSYSVIYGKDDFLEIPADLDSFKSMLEEIETGAAAKLDEFLAQAKYKYQVGIHNLVKRPSRSLMEFASLSLIKDVMRMDIFQSMSSHVRKFFKSEKIIRLMEFPVLFLGETAENIPALYSLMNYADIVLGTWYPKGGMHEIIKGMVALAEEKGVEIRYNAEVEEIEIDLGEAKRIRLISGEKIKADVVIAGADYHHVDRHLVNP